MMTAVKLNSPPSQRLLPENVGSPAEALPGTIVTISPPASAPVIDRFFASSRRTQEEARPAAGRATNSKRSMRSALQVMGTLICLEFPAPGRRCSTGAARCAATMPLKLTQARP